MRFKRLFIVEMATVAIPVTCPICGSPGHADIPEIVLATALIQWNQMRLDSPCHAHAWDASADELAAIRNHLGADWMVAKGKQFLQSEALD
jgi:hypothetical protein